jgi:PAS domain S-box-containing protein
VNRRRQVEEGVGIRMANSSKRKGFSGPGLHLANLFLAFLVILTITFCLLLYTGMGSTRKSLEVLGRTEMVPPAALEELRARHNREQTLDLVLIGMSACMGVGLFVIFRYLVRVSATLREVRTIERDVLNSITRGIVTVNLQGKLTSCNRALEQILDVKGAEVLGRPMGELFSPEDPLYELLEESIQERARPRDRDLEYTTGTGRTLTLRLTTFALRNEGGERVGGILLVKDMTEMRKMEERIQRASRLAALGELTQRLVHEIRNPLSAMDINLQLLQERLEVGEEEQEVGRYLRTMADETRRLNEVLHNAQLFVQPRSAMVEPVDLHRILGEVTFLLKEEAGRKGIEISHDLQAETSLVLGDVNQLKQAFINVFKNSIEAMPDGGKLEVVTRNASGGTVIGVELVDTGGGIHLAELQRIFDPYFTTKKKGTGLGLSIVHKVIAQHGGSIDVSSWLGEGTILSIILPIASQAEADHGSPNA